MEDKLHILPTYSTPEVIIDTQKGLISLKGKSVPEDSVSFYKPILDFVDNFDSSLIGRIYVYIEFEYFNSNSSKFILDLLLKIAALKEINEKLIAYIDWVVDKNDDDMIEAGEDYKAIVKLPFKILSKEEALSSGDINLN